MKILHRYNWSLTDRQDRQLLTRELVIAFIILQKS